MDWVHCNNCCVQPCQGPDKPRFLLTNCGHIICKQCSTENISNKCRVCGAIYRAVPLTSKMKPEIERFFMNPMDLLKRSLHEVQSVTEFQQGHRVKLLEHLQRRLQMQDRITKELDARCRMHEMRVKKLDEQLRSQMRQQMSASPSGSFLGGAVSSRPFRRTPQGSMVGWPAVHGSSSAVARDGVSPYMDMARRHFQGSPSTAASISRRAGNSPADQRPSQTLLAKLFASPGISKPPNFI